MMNVTGTVKTLCPFYTRESRLQITCEGIEADTMLATKFDSEKKKIEYQEQNCFKYPNTCPIMIMLENMYK